MQNSSYMLMGNIRFRTHPSAEHIVEAAKGSLSDHLRAHYLLYFFAKMYSVGRITIPYVRMHKPY